MALADGHQVAPAERQDLNEGQTLRRNVVNQEFSCQDHVLADDVIARQDLSPLQTGALADDSHGVPDRYVLVRAEDVADETLGDGYENGLLDGPQVIDAAAGRVHPRRHSDLPLQPRREPLHGPLLVPLSMHVEGLEEVLPAALPQAHIQAAVLHEKVQVIHQLVRVRGEHVYALERADHVREHPGPEGAQHDHRDGEQSHFQLVLRQNVSVTDAGEGGYAPIEGEVVDLHRRTALHLNTMAVLLQPCMEPGVVRLGFHGQVGPGASNPMADDEGDEEGAARLQHRDRVAEMHLPLRKELDDTDQSEHAGEPHHSQEN
mmetsp:Transcript_71953/g.227426  ORF Transcript_71953/g.227426 Transcript_71953/m.227426 type:complete len:318 (+) Transcript_71953:411-1364(+)